MIHEIAVLIVAREEAEKKPGADPVEIREKFNAGVREVLDGYRNPKKPSEAEKPRENP